MTIAQGILVVVGLLSGLVLIGALLWSIVRPSKRIWPPNREHSVIPNIAWGLTLAVFGAVIGLGILDWKSASMANALRWAVGPFLIATGNLIVWWGAFSIGLKATDLPPVGPSFIMRVCRLDLGILVPRLAQARRAGSPQIAQVRGALAVASGCPRMSVA